MKIDSKQKGFTLIELMISIFVFSIIALVVGGLFVQILGLERRSFAAQNIQENGLYAMELMSREIRVSQVQSFDQTPAGDSTDCSLTSLTIRHPVNGIVTYKLDALRGVLTRTTSEGTADLTSTDVTFSRLNFCLLGSSPNDQKQVRVGIIMSLQSGAGNNLQTANLETTVSSRDVQTEFQN